MCKGWSERDVTWFDNQSPFKTILPIFKRETCLNINDSQASKDQSRVWLEFIIKGLTDVIDLNPANWDACALGSLRLWTEERLTTTLSNQSLIPRLLSSWGGDWSWGWWRARYHSPADYEWSFYVPTACARPIVINERSNTSWIDHQESRNPAESQSDEIIEGGTVNYGQILISSLQLWRYFYQMPL